MKALSIKQPWAWAILNAGKDIENRDWFTKFRGTVAIHASKGLTYEEYGDAWNFMHYEISESIGEKIPSFHQIERGAILGTVEIIGCTDNSDSPWFFGKYGFELRNPQLLKTPIPCKGALGLWDVPKEIEAQILQRNVEIVTV